MEIAGAVFRHSPCLFPTTYDVSTSRHLQSFPTTNNFSSFRPKQQLCRKSVVPLVSSGEFSDKSHLQYYNSPRMAVKEKDEIALKKKEMKKKMKVLKGLSKNLSTFTDMGFGLNLDSGLDQQVKGQMISEATEVLLAQLQKLKAEKRESKRMKKEEKAKKKAAQMMTECKDSSSSESSSESDCENVVNMKQLKTVKTPNTVQETEYCDQIKQLKTVKTPNTVQETEYSDQIKQLKTVKTPNAVQETESSDQILEKSENRVAVNAICTDVKPIVEVGCSKKIEVCMGGKCKKSGAAMLLENFQAAVVGGEAAVVGCKCMGKCRDGPNVRVRDEMMNPAPLCIGVGLEDVDSIVSNFFGGNQRSSEDSLHFDSTYVGKV